ncbi:Putative peroxiredoxin bcp [Anaerolineae bacterium]|nr:Putative peroxiredoxin bcp [Anaerolineae bacterium]
MFHLKEGDKAPDFNSVNETGSAVGLSDYRGKKLVLYFYPKDATPSCTTQAIEFSDLEEEFARQHAVVIGISRDDCMSHADFRDQHGLALILLADVDGKVCERYGVLQEREVDGIRKLGIQRTTFVIDKDGNVRHILRDVTPKGHAQEILNLIKEP